MDNNILSLFQLCDSNLPTGAFSHSFGLETYIQENLVIDDKSFYKWLQVYVNEQLIYTDGLSSRLVYEALLNDDMQQIWELDRKLTVQNLPRETREGTQMIGDRMLKLATTLYDMPSLLQYREQIKKKQGYGHPSFVFTMVAFGLGITKPNAILYYLYSNISSLVQNAVRAIPLGQTAGQQIIHDFQSELTTAVEKVLELSEEDFGVVSPGLELSQMKHERVNIRIFMS